MNDPTLLDDLKAVVQYARKDTGLWSTMAAFDLVDVATRYAENCSSEGCPWEYRVIAIDKED